MRIGVFICHCGSNIEGTVDCKKVAQEAYKFPFVIYSTDYAYMCSENGQELIIKAIKEHDLDRVVVASCSPKMHEPTFQRAIKRGGLNPYMFEMANIREHCSWIHTDTEDATEKAIDLVKKAVYKVAMNRELFSTTFEISKDVLVIGGGIAGIQAALDVAAGGHKVVLVEKDQTIGGKMAMLDKTFPTIDCSACILTPKMVDAASDENIELLAYSEIEDVSGYVGNFTVKIRKKATYVDWFKCTGCEQCVAKCPTRIPDKFNQGIGKARAINKAFPQAIPNRVVIDGNVCKFITEGKCGNCKKACPAGAVDFDMKDEIIERKVGAIIVAIGNDIFDASQYVEYGYGRYEDVVTTLQYERMMCASGPSQGHILRPSNHQEPKNVVFLSCVGSRDNSVGRPYCSSVCCMIMAKQAILTKEHMPDSTSYLFYIDVRATGKEYEEFIDRAREDYGALYIRGRVSRIFKRGDKLIVRGVNTLLGDQVDIEADLVVLSVGLTSSPGAAELAQKLNISYDSYGFLVEGHPKLKPVETNTAGIYLAGTCQGPKDIPASVAQGGAAAAKALSLLSKDKLESSPLVAFVNNSKCVGCFKCQKVCPYKAIEKVVLRDGREVANVVSSVCQGCGTCTVACPTGAIDLNGFSDKQLINELEGLFV
jgi:heterodisulfide reductase subunit A